MNRFIGCPEIKDILWTCVLKIALSAERLGVTAWATRPADSTKY